MISDELHARIRRIVKPLKKFADRFWYPPFLGLLATLDNLIVIIPTDGLLISSSMLTPRRWFFLGASVAIGSTAGAMLLAYLVERHGLPWILELYPHVQETAMWEWSMGFFEQYGLLLVFLVGLSPLMQQPPIILASLANTPLLKFFAVVFAARTIKYLVLAYVGSHTPRLLNKIWGLRTELEDTGIQIKSDA